LRTIHARRHCHVSCPKDRDVVGGHDTVAPKRDQEARHQRQIVAHTLKEGDRGGASATPDISEKED
jgi:hypothetical protein